jgi:MoaA/NifB/PqqE/SkfB family radical SAM enzyme
MGKIKYLKKESNGSINISSDDIGEISAAKHQEYIITEENGKLILTPSIHSLSRLYIEPTSACNLSCVTCIRRTWDEAPGFMTKDTFDTLLKQLSDFTALESVMFGGFGEPMHHPEIFNMIRSLKSLGLKVEMTTNGTMLNAESLKELFDTGLDSIWVSIDSTETLTFNAIREGADFSGIYESLKLFKRMNQDSKRKLTLGIAFVVTKDNVKDLSNLRSFAASVWAEKISVSNVIPYDREMEGKMLCRKVLFKPLAYTKDEEQRMGFKEIIIPEISLPRIDYTELTKDGLHDIRGSMMKVKTLNESFNSYDDHCKFIHDRISFIRWDGMVSPCMGLLHSYTTYLNGNERRMNEYTLGRISEKTFKEIWDSQEYRDFRESVYKFDFSPCVLCGGCKDINSNSSDCRTDSTPVCGGCLWAQGVIQCP